MVKYDINNVSKINIGINTSLKVLVEYIIQVLEHDIDINNIGSVHQGVSGQTGICSILDFHHIQLDNHPKLKGFINECNIGFILTSKFLTNIKFLKPYLGLTNYAFNNNQERLTAIKSFYNIHYI